MNHIYRIVWNHATACYQAVTESAKGQGKTVKSQNARQALDGPPTLSLRRMPLTATALGAALSMLSLPGFAGPAGGQVTAGSATISQAGSATTINQTSSKAAIDWTRFSVGSHESVRFNQPSASAITLNRVTGAESSAIMGSLSANGQVFILNPNGVLFGAGSQVNVGGLVASTLRLDNASFMAGNYKFTGDGASSVVNNGTITVAPGGALALMAPVVQNTGTLSAPGGSVLLAGAQAVTLTLQTDGGLVAYTLDSGSVQALVDNGGLIQAGGGHVVLTAKGVDALSQAVVNHSGVIEAQTVASKSGVIELLGDMQSGAVHLSGKLDASAPNGGDGGFIDTSAAQVQIADTAKVTTAAAAGQTGTWLIDPTDFTIAAGNGSSTTSSIGAATLAASLGSTDVKIATSATGAGKGDIFVNSALNWSANKLTLAAHRNININANLNGSGTAKLALNYGQGSANGIDSDYILGNGAKVNLPAGQNFSTKQGSAGIAKNFTVITSLGSVGSTTGNDLQGIIGNLTGNYALGGDIDAAATTDWNSRKGFNPIGFASNAYSGDFHGLGHVIANISINRPGEQYAGLFGYASGRIQDVGVEKANIIAGGFYGNAAGILVGSMAGSIVRSYTTGSLKSITSVGSAGGLVGTLGVLPASISQSYSTASVESSHAAGGLVGYFFGKIEDSYATGKVFNNTYAAGGLVGINNGEITRGYSTGEVFGSSSKGGLVGIQGRDRPATTTDSYWDKDTSKLAKSSSGTGKTTAEMQQQATYAGWDFVNTWRMVEGSSYPMLRALTQGKITLSASARDIEKVYDKTAWHGGIIDYSGFATGDTTSNLSGTLKWIGTAEGAVNAGHYTLVPTGFSSQKYEIEYLPGMLTIQPRPLDITVSKTYNGNATFTSGFAVTNGVVAGDPTPTITGTATVGSGNAGTYNAFGTNNLLTDNPNYTANLQYVYSGVLGKVAATIDSAALSLIGISGSRTYDGTSNANWNDNTYLVGDVLAADKGKVSLVSGTGTLASKNVGTQALTDLGTLQLGGEAAGNYQLNKGASSWTISPARLGVTGKADTRSYNGTTNATGSIFKYSGQLFGTDSLSGGKLVFADANAGVDKFVKVSGVTVADDNGGRNYSISYLDGWGTIDPRPVNITVSKTYDGSRLFDSNFQVSNRIGNDVINISGFGMTAAADVGNYNAFVFSSLALSNSNYTLAGGKTTAVIDRAPLSLLGSRDYNGTTDAYVLDVNSIQGKVAGDELKVYLASGVGVLDKKEPGNSQLKSIGSLQLGGEAAHNYVLTINDSKWVVAPLIENITCSNPSNCKDINTTPALHNKSSNAYSDAFIKEWSLLGKTAYSEIVGNTLGITFGEIMLFLEKSDIFSKYRLGVFANGFGNVSQRVAKKAFVDATKIDFLDMGRGALMAYALELIKDDIMQTLNIDRSTPAGVAGVYLVNQLFIFAQVMITGGSPVAAVIAEGQQLNEDIDDLVGLSKDIDTQNEGNISSVANIINSLANMVVKAENAEAGISQENKDLIKKTVFDSLEFVNKDVLPKVQFSTVSIILNPLTGVAGISGNSITPVTDDLLAAKIYLLENTPDSRAKALNLVYKVQQYSQSFINSDINANKLVGAAILQLIHDMNLDSIGTQLRQG